MNKISKKVSTQLFLLFCVFVSSLVLDQISKVHSEEALLLSSDKDNVKLYHGKQIPLLSTGDRLKGTYFSFGLQYVRNQGAAWGALQNLDDSIREPFFYGVTLLAVIMIMYFFRTTPTSHRLARMALVLVLSGAIGNFLDRIRLTYVIDWIDVRWRVFGWYYDFPKFNIADSCITLGVTFLLIDMLILEPKRNKKQKPQENQTLPQQTA